jgi:hypothetical protein
MFSMWFIHNDYDILELIIDSFATFNCELYIPNVDELKMEDGIIILLSMSKMEEGTRFQDRYIGYVQKLHVSYIKETLVA